MNVYTHMKLYLMITITLAISYLLIKITIKTLPAKTIILATGTKPNLTSIQESQLLSSLDKDLTHIFDLEGNNTNINSSSKFAKKDSIFISSDRKSVFLEIYIYHTEEA